MSKERMREMENLDVSLLKGTKFYEHWLWLIEQWHLDDKAFADLDSDYIDIRRQNKRYRKALEFYADDYIWHKENRGSDYWPDYRCEAQDDGGEKARQALESDAE